MAAETQKKRFYAKVPASPAHYSNNSTNEIERLRIPGYGGFAPKRQEYGGELLVHTLTVLQI